MCYIIFIYSDIPNYIKRYGGGTFQGHFPKPVSSEEAPNEPRCAQGQLLRKHHQKQSAEIAWFAGCLSHSRSCWLGTSCLPRGLPADRNNERPGPHYFQVVVDSTDISLNNVKERRKPLCYVCHRRTHGSNEGVGENQWHYCKRNWKFMNHETESNPTVATFSAGVPERIGVEEDVGPNSVFDMRWHFTGVSFFFPPSPPFSLLKFLRI